MRKTTRAARADALRALMVLADAADRPQLEVRIEKAASACGCSTGGVALLVAVATILAWWVVVRGGKLVGWHEAGLAALLVITATVFGKLVGLAAADLWLWTTRRKLERCSGGDQPNPAGEPL